MSGIEMKIFISRRTVLPEGVKRAIIAVWKGKIEHIFFCDDEKELEVELLKYPGMEREDFGNMVLMPGVVDSHVHVNEPGRTEWEGFSTATKAAAVGGVTTIVDMPLNSIPPTTSVNNLKIKASAAQAKSFVDVAFWGGVVPENQKDIKPLVEAGVVGFKCFLCPSGIEEFPSVNEEDVKKALAEMQNLNTVLAFHAEYTEEEGCCSKYIKGDPKDYDTFLKTRPPVMELAATAMITNLCKSYNCRCHIVHLSASEALILVKEAKKKQLPLTAETCYHYLYLTAEQIPRGAAEFKCCPPIRDQNNQEKLWKGLEDGTLDMVVSDHSPCTENLKTDDFLSAWGGISSLQFGLSLFWSRAQSRGFQLEDVARLLCSAPAKLCGLEHRKGSLNIGLDADFVVWDPESTIEIQSANVFHKNKLTPYLGEKLQGKVFATIVRGHFVYQNGEVSNEPHGRLLLKKSFLSDLKNL